MTGHRITYEAIGIGAHTVYRAVCRCGEHREARTAARVSSWGPEHVVAAFERQPR